MPYFVRFLAPVMAGLLSLGATASTLVIDGFAAPTSPVIGVASGAPGSPGSALQMFDSSASVLGGERVVYFDITANSGSGGASIAVGGGLVHVQQEAGVAAEAVYNYGAFTGSYGVPDATGPFLGLDLSSYAALAFDFKSASDSLNLVFTLYTHAPLDPSNPVVYATQGINVAPPPPGTPMTAWVVFDKRPEFNWAQVDGIAVLVNRANPVPGTSYRLEGLSFVSSVPEPHAAWLLLAGGLLVAGRLRLQRKG